jgi:outer membrane murein-binding lipoprotein Lpp
MDEKQALLIALDALQNKIDDLEAKLLAAETENARYRERIRELTEQCDRLWSKTTVKL